MRATNGRPYKTIHSVKLCCTNGTNNVLSTSETMLRFHHKRYVPSAHFRRGEYHSPAGDQWSPLQQRCCDVVAIHEDGVFDSF